MGNLLNGVSFKEPTTVEDCDSTWDTDSGGEDEEDEGEGTENEDEGREGSKEEEDDRGEERGTEERLQDLVAGAEVKADGKSIPVTEQVQDKSDSNTADQNIKPKRSFYAARDLYKYRHQYPQNFKDLRCQNDLCNLRFYMNKIPFKPDGVYIEEILNKWNGDYEKLEHNHTYIQWLFPLREQGLNFCAKELSSYEIEEFKKTKEAIKRFLLAYKMMLDFFGIKLTDKTGNVLRAPNWQERFQHLNESQHNYLRITRILKSLGELGFESFKYPLVKIFLQESVVENTIPNMKQSALEYFVYTIKDRRERRRLLRFACRHYQPPNHFIWGPNKKQRSEENKTAKKTTPPSRSHKKHCHIEKKSMDSKILQVPDSPKAQYTEEMGMQTTQMDDINKQLTAECISVAETGNCNDGIVKKENNVPKPEEINLHSYSDYTISLDLKPDLEEPESENVNKRCFMEEIIIVESSDEGGKDCLCSLSPVTQNIDDATLPTEENIKTDLERKVPPNSQTSQNVS
ncbi:opioid growth factor receptor-like protein 1 [Rhinophrynus dorsalis]